MGVSDVKEVIPDTELQCHFCEVRPMCKMMCCRLLGNDDIQRNFEIMIAKGLNIDGLYGLFHFIFIPICI